MVGVFFSIAMLVYQQSFATKKNGWKYHAWTTTDAHPQDD